MFLKSLRSSGSGDREPNFVTRHSRPAFGLLRVTAVCHQRTGGCSGGTDHWAPPRGEDDGSVAHMSAQPERPTRSASAERMRRARERRKRGARVVMIELYGPDIVALAQLGWMASADCDREALGASFCAFVNQALALRVTPAPLLMRYSQLIEFRSGEGFTCMVRGRKHRGGRLIVDIAGGPRRVTPAAYVGWERREGRHCPHPLS